MVNCMYNYESPFISCWGTTCHAAQWFTSDLVRKSGQQKDNLNELFNRDVLRMS